MWMKTRDISEFSGADARMGNSGIQRPLSPNGCLGRGVDGGGSSPVRRHFGLTRHRRSPRLPRGANVRFSYSPALTPDPSRPSPEAKTTSRCVVRYAYLHTAPSRLRLSFKAR